MSKLGIGTGITPDDGNGDSLLDGAVKINSNFDEIYSYFGDGTNLSASWQKVSSGINTTLNVGVGTTNPRFTLEVGAVGASGTSLYVNGDARVAGILTVGSSSITLDGSNNILKVGTGVTIYGNSGIVSATDFYANDISVSSLTAGTIIYEGVTLVNAWQETDVGINTLSNVGIGTTNPTSALTVKGNTSLENITVSGVSTFQNNIRLGDNDIIQLGNDQDLGISHNGSSSEIEAFNNTLRLKSSSNDIVHQAPVHTFKNGVDSETLAVFTENGSVELYYDNSKKFETLGAGVTVTGTTFTDQLSVSGVSTFVGSANFGSALVIGTNSLESLIQSNSPSQFLIRNNAGLINLKSNEINLISDPIGAPEYLLRGFGDGAVELYNNGNKKFETLGVGVTVTGTTFTDQLSVSGVSTFNNNVRVTGNVRVSGIVTTNSILVSNDGGNNGSVLIEDTGAYSQITFRTSSGLNGTSFQGVESNLYITPGSGGYIGLSGPTKNIFYETGDVVLNNGLQGTTHAANGFRVTGLTSTTSFNVGTGGTIINATAAGLVGIGTTNPTSKLTVRDGDISVGVDNTHGLILTSPNGTQYRLIVDNAGALSTVTV